MKKKLFFTFLFFLFAVPFFSACGVQSEEKELAPALDLSFFGSSPLEAEKLLGVSLEEVAPSESIGDPLPENTVSYRPAEACSIAGYPVDMELFFETRKTPAGNQVGLYFVSINLPSDPDLDLKSFADYLEEAYEIPPISRQKENNEEDGRVLSFTTFSDSIEVTEALFQAYQEVFVKDWQMPANPAVYTYYLQGNVKSDDSANIWIDARLSAIFHHIEDYENAPAA